MSEINVLKGRRLSMDGARLIGTGFFSNVYLINEDTVVKVLKGTDYSDAEREILLSKWALRKGIPTAISFDVADVDGHPGLVYESLGRGNVRNELRDHPEDFDRIMGRYVDLLKTINSVADDEHRLPKALDEYRAKLDYVRDMMNGDEYERMKLLLCTVPDRDTLVHRDCHIKNIKVLNGELLLIDIDTLSRGDPIFELMALYCCYKLFFDFNNSDFDTFFEMPVITLKNIMSRIIELYFSDLSDELRAENEKKIRLMGYLHMLWFVKTNLSDNTAAREAISRGFSASIYEVDDLRLQY